MLDSSSYVSIVVEVKALGLTHVLKVLLGVKKDVLPVKCFHSIKSSFLFPSNFMEIIRLSQSLGKSDHPQFWGYYRS